MTNYIAALIELTRKMAEIIHESDQVDGGSAEHDSIIDSALKTAATLERFIAEPSKAEPKNDNKAHFSECLCGCTKDC